jgi:hypothetical protein
MSMRPHGKAQVSALKPRALAICDRCQFMVNHDTLRWQMRWRGPRLQNIRMLVCQSCYDVPNEQEKTIILPIDPVTIANARPENYALADNPVSGLGYDPASAFMPPTQLGMSIGNLTMGGGVNAAFDGAVVTSSLGTTISRRFPNCANLANSNSSYNWVGKNWAADATGTLATMPSTVPAQTHIVSSFTLIAPSDQAFLRTGVTSYFLQGSANGVTWTTIFAGTTAGTAGEIITANTTSQAPYPYHRVAIQGDGISQVGIAQVELNIADAGPNEI